MPTLLALPVTHEIGGNGIKPRAETVLGIELVPVLEHAHEGFLREILRLGRVLQLADEVMIKPRAMALHEVVQRRTVPATQAFHVLTIQFVARLSRHDGGGARFPTVPSARDSW